MEAVVAAAIAVVGVIWLVWPQPSMLIPGALVIDEGVARAFGFAAPDIDRIRRAGGFPSPWDIVRSRLFGAAFITVATTAFITHAAAAIVFVEVACVIYGFILISAALLRERFSGPPSAGFQKGISRLAFRDRALVVTALIAFGNAVFVAGVPGGRARLIALAIAAVIPVLGYVRVAFHSANAKSPLHGALAARQECGFDVTALLTANVLALACATVSFDHRDVLVEIVKGWSVLGIGMALYYTRIRFASLNKDLQVAFR